MTDINNISKKEKVCKNCIYHKDRDCITVECCRFPNAVIKGWLMKCGEFKRK